MQTYTAKGGTVFEYRDAHPGGVFLRWPYETDEGPDYEQGNFPLADLIEFAGACGALWNPTSERLPAEGTDVLAVVWCRETTPKTRKVRSVRFYGGRFRDESGAAFERVSEWMLPPAMPPLRPGAWREAMGCAPAAPGSISPEEAVRRVRGYPPAEAGEEE